MTSRTKLLLLLGFFAAPMIAAWVSYSGWHPEKHKNYGSLLTVTPLAHTAGTLLDGTPYTLDALKGKWLMVYVGEAACDAACTTLLYYMRQSHISQGKDQERVERVWVVTDAGTPLPALLKLHTGLRVWRAGEPVFFDQFPAARTGAHHIYVVDPLGNLMLRFPENADPKGIIKDMKLLLKASQIG
jgi:hypothetical protein